MSRGSGNESTSVEKNMINMVSCKRDTVLDTTSYLQSYHTKNKISIERYWLTSIIVANIHKSTTIAGGDALGWERAGEVISERRAP